MSKITVYHGSSNVIEHPVWGAGKEYNDYGRGFYCTEYIELAKEWGCSSGTDGFANQYSLELDGLQVLNLSSEEYNILNWLAILMDNRIGRLNSPVERMGKEYLIRNFTPDYHNYDIIIGYRADDSYFSFARAFVSNTISLKQLQYAMKLGKLGEQIVLISQNAFNAIQFKGYEVADHTIYFAKKKARDEHARDAYFKELEDNDLNGIFMRDIIREGLKADDQRLR